MSLALVGLLIGGGLSVVAVAPTPASTVAAPVDLEWTAPPGCPTTAEVLERVAPGPDAHPVRAEGIVSEDAGGWSLELRVEGYGGSDQRTLDGESCEALADAAALLIRVATGPEPETEPETEPAGELEPEPEASPAVATIVRPESPEIPPATRPAEPDLPPRKGLPLDVHARGAGMLQLGTLLPGTVAGGAAVAAGVSVSWLRAEARGTYLAPREQVDADDPSIRIRVDGWGVGASGCGVWEGGRLFVPMCVGAQVGRTRARAFGIRQPGVGRGLWAHVVADLALGVRVSRRVALTAGAEAVISLERPSFRVRGFPPLFRTGPAAARVVLGVEVLLRRSPARDPR